MFESAQGWERWRGGKEREDIPGEGEPGRGEREGNNMHKLGSIERRRRNKTYDEVGQVCSNCHPHDKCVESQ